MARLLQSLLVVAAALSESVLCVPLELQVDSGLVTAVPALRFSVRPTALQAASTSTSTAPALTSSKSEDRATAIFQNKFIIITTVTTTQTSTVSFTSSSFSSCYTTQVAGLTTCSVGQLFVGRRRRMWPRIEDTPIEPVGSLDGKKVSAEELIIKASRVQESCEPTAAVETEVVAAKDTSQSRTIETGAVAGIQAVSNDIIKINDENKEEEDESTAETTTEANAEDIVPSDVDPPVAVDLMSSLESSAGSSATSSLAHITFYQGVLPTTTLPNDSNRTVTTTVTHNYDDKFILIRETKTTMVTTTQTNTVIGAAKQTLAFSTVAGGAGCFPLGLLNSAGIGPC